MAARRYSGMFVAPITIHAHCTKQPATARTGLCEANPESNTTSPITKEIATNKPRQTKFPHKTQFLACISTGTTPSSLSPVLRPTSLVPQRFQMPAWV
ncbi:hypothetical protein K440DRAFT_233582 [Wilcoxina mikolae CBS 423.85]|nr:hypothetical protein K440DRAFT_233582 [Wilcoxina mikolae CBS 423.85]